MVEDVSPTTHGLRSGSYDGLRYYKPEFGRWVSRDPIGEWGGINTHAFIQNMPTSLIDPDGREPLTEPGTGGKQPCCGVTKLHVKWPRSVFLNASSCSADIEITWVGTDLNLCEARQWIKTNVIMPGLSKTQIINAYSTIAWPWPPYSFPNAPFFDRWDWKVWRTLPFTDPEFTFAGKNSSSSPLPTQFELKFDIQVRDKAFGVVKLTHSYNYRQPRIVETTVIEPGEQQKGCMVDAAP